ncbi:tetratricopeptide repeat protein [Sphingobacterium haloxyli]|uniref:Uncharacterized protein n=1 Tax=Sphingobacterium haloxyli TaxID=2100533 RepID=A0A2S9J9F1_9SPHI|nr:tetratricopeptide repeat protein [Sphingobacterium haloxyli]PRD49401.1 hypothetical protein C5745_01925 [Sphingobacterium haloxyli]
MKHILFTFIILIFTSHLAQAQNEIKARLEYEDSEVAFQNKDYQKAILHLDNAEKLLGTWTAKTGYLKIIALDHIIDYAIEWGDNLTDLSRNVEQYMKYVNQSSDKVDLDKVREIYAIEKRVDFAKKKKEFELDADYKAGKDAYENKDYNLAMTHYLNAAKKNNTRAMDQISDMYRDGVGFEVDYQKSLEWDTKGSELGDPICTSDIGNMYLAANGVAQDYKKALEHLSMGADYGIGYAISRIGYMHSWGYGITRNFQEAFNWFSKAVIKGDPQGMLYMGHFYYTGTGVEQNYSEAINWFKKSGNPFGFFKIGEAYLNGYGVEKNDAEALKWYKRAADSGDPYYTIVVGNMYFEGKGTTQNYQTALDWYNKAFENKLENGEVKNSSLYLTMGTCHFELKNYSQSMEWYTKAYETGESEAGTAKEMIAKMYEEGLGVEKDKRKAREWRNK